MLRFFISLIFSFSIAFPAIAESSLALSDIREAYADAAITVHENVAPVDSAFIREIENAFGPEGPVEALRNGLSDAVLYVFTYGGYQAAFLTQQEDVVLSFFYLPVFSLTGSAPPDNYVEIATDISARMTHGDIDPQMMASFLQASIEEAHAYGAGTSQEEYPGLIYRKGPGYHLSTHAYVPDWITITTSRITECPFTFPKRGWMGQFICANAGTE